MWPLFALAFSGGLLQPGIRATSLSGICRPRSLSIPAPSGLRAASLGLTRDATSQRDLTRRPRSSPILALNGASEGDASANLMKRADRPSEEEMIGVSYLGGAAGAFVWRHVLGRSALVGAMLGVAVARGVANQPTKAGAYAREAGWAAHTQFLAAQARGRAACSWAVAEAQQLGLPPPNELLGMAEDLLRKVSSMPTASAQRAHTRSLGLT